jgi:hypothetical protein
LVIIDPISSYMGKIDSHKNTEVRGALEPASEMAERLKVAILSITHFSKSGGNTGKALHRFIGSIAFVGAPRAAFAVIEDVDHEDRILFLHAKNNMAPKAQGLAYRLFQTIVGDGEGIVASYVVWDGNPVTMSANEALRATDGGGDRTGQPRQRSSCGRHYPAAPSLPPTSRPTPMRLGFRGQPSAGLRTGLVLPPSANRKGEMAVVDGCGHCRRLQGAHPTCKMLTFRM